MSQVVSQATSQVLERARHGHADAISILLKRHFKPQGIFTQVLHQENQLQVVLEAMDPPEPQRTLRWLLPTLESLHPEGVTFVQIQARRSGDRPGLSTSGWVENFRVQAGRLVAFDQMAVQMAVRTSSSELVPLAQRGDLAAIQTVVDRAVGNPNIRTHIALTVPRLRVTIQTIQFLDGSQFFLELARKLRDIASPKIQILEFYKQKTGASSPVLMQEVNLNDLDRN
jgi:hypothetical protein